MALYFPVQISHGCIDLYRSEFAIKTVANGHAPMSMDNSLPVDQSCSSYTAAKVAAAIV